MMSEAASPFDILTEIDALSRSRAGGLPASEEDARPWHGIGFALADQHYVAPMGEVTEILHVPRLTRIPGVKSFMLGAANVRGRLLPVVDLNAFFGLPHAVPSLRDRRVLVVEHDDLFAGLVVDDVLGMQYFAEDRFESDPLESRDRIRPFLHGRYERDGDAWKVFSTRDLTRDPHFLDAAQW